ncbi:adenosine deaminase [Acidobacteria bacterium AH-259-D05]|nr:adenosine deaminase [Acidobacteria bacterium AH-259-D05]
MADTRSELRDTARSTVSEEYLKRLPKAELHLHLEGSVTPSILRELSRKYKTEYCSLTEEALQEQLFQYRDFDHFLETYRIVCEHLRKPEDYSMVLGHLAGYFEEQNIRYAEIIYTPSIPWKAEREGKKILIALLEESLKIHGNQGTVIRWILDCVRQFGSQWAWRTAELAEEFCEKGVVGLGLGGDEKSLAMKEYQEVFAWIRAHRLFAHVHAGEIGEVQQVWDALLILGARRIGHGIQAVRDPSLMDYLRQHAIGLDVCLTSNLKTGAWTPISDNPFGLLYQRGVPVSLNTDDPGLFQTSLNDEFQKAVRFFRLGQEEVHHIVLQGVRSSFLPHQEKMALMREFQEEIHRI